MDRPKPVLALLAVIPALAFAQGITIEQLKPAVIQHRLKLATEKADDRYKSLEKLIDEAGCSANLNRQPVKRMKQPNLECVLPGKGDSEIIVGAHFDMTGDGIGAADNWSGAALLPSLYQSLSRHPRRHTIRFVGFTGEEKGLLGSTAYEKAMNKEVRRRTVAMVSLDTLGLGPLRVWQTASDAALSGHLFRLAERMNQEVGIVNAEQVGSGDHVPFIKAGIPTLTLHSLTQPTLGILHSGLDQFDAIKAGPYYDTYRLIAVYLALLDVSLSPEH